MYVRIYVGIHICMHALVGCCDAKRRYHRVDPDRFIDVSCFADGLQCRSVSYRLSSVAVHLGKAPDRGHCQTLFAISLVQSLLLLVMESGRANRG